MKKHLLLPLLVVLTIFAFGQDKFGQVTGSYKNLVLEPIQIHPNQMTTNTGEFVSLKSTDATAMGTTWNDVQVYNYGNIMQRIWAYDDGTIGATWIGMGPGTPGVPERGAAYNYFDGSDWGEANLHVGADDRMGMPSYAPWGENGEIIVQYKYIVGEGPMMLYKREVKGEGEWEELELIPPAAGLSLTWHSMITSGDENEYIHLLARTYDAPYMGQTNALLYYRSSDGGETWEIDGVIIDGLGEDYFTTTNELSYAWANPVGSNIAFTYGFDEFGGRVFKSDDHGDSWEIIEVYTTPFSSLDPPDVSEAFGCGISTSAIALDSDGEAHVIFARMKKEFTDGVAGWYPYTDGLIYWNESMEVLDTTVISSYTLEFLAEGGYLIGWLDESLEIPEGQPNYGTALWGFPQISIDAENNMFVATSTVSNYEYDGLLYRHIFVNSSFDGGLNWEGQVDLNDDPLYMYAECAYPAMAPVISDKVQIVYQQDVLPGIHEWLGDHGAIENEMISMSFDKDFFVGVGEQLEQSAVIKLSDGYPNPTEYSVSFTLKLEKNADVSMSLTSIVGQIVKTKNIGQLQSGTNLLSFDLADLSPGTYFCTIDVDHQKFSRKIIITR